MILLHAITMVYVRLQQMVFGNVLVHLGSLVQHAISHHACRVHARTMVSAPSMAVRLFVHVQADFRELFVKSIRVHLSQDQSWKVMDHVTMAECAMYLVTHSAALVLPVILVLHVTSLHVLLSHASIMAFALLSDQHFHVIVQLDILEIHARQASATKFLEIPYSPDLIMVLLKNVATMEIAPLSVTRNMLAPVTKDILEMTVNLDHVMLSTALMVALNSNQDLFAIVYVLQVIVAVHVRSVRVTLILV